MKLNISVSVRIQNDITDRELQNKTTKQMKLNPK